MNLTPQEKHTNRLALTEAITNLQHRHQTRGPCHYCEWPITHCSCVGRSRKVVLVCALCRELIKWGEEFLPEPTYEDYVPAMAI